MVDSRLQLHFDPPQILKGKRSNQRIAAMKAHLLLFGASGGIATALRKLPTG
mgnify:CR=1 FL=1